MTTKTKSQVWKIWRINGYMDVHSREWIDDTRRAITDTSLPETVDEDDVIAKLKSLRILRADAQPNVEFEDDVIYITDVETGEPLLELERYSL